MNEEMREAAQEVELNKTADELRKKYPNEDPFSESQLVDALAEGLERGAYGGIPGREPEPAGDPEDWLDDEVITETPHPVQADGVQQQLQTEFQRLQHDWAIASQTYQSTDWESLEQEDPGQYAAQQLKHQQKAAALNQRLQQLEQAANQVNASHQQQALAAQQDYIQREQQKLLNKIPAWRDPVQRASEIKTIRNFLYERGFADYEVSGLADHRAILMIRDLVKAQQAPKPQRKPAQRKEPIYDAQERFVLKNHPQSEDAYAIRLSKIL